MTDLGNLSDQATPVLTDLGAVAPSLNRSSSSRAVLARAATKSLTPSATRRSPAARRSSRAGRSSGTCARSPPTSRPLAQNLAEILTSLRDTGGIERVLDYVFYQVAAINGFDAVGPLPARAAGREHSARPTRRRPTRRARRTSPRPARGARPRRRRSLARTTGARRRSPAGRGPARHEPGAGARPDPGRRAHADRPRSARPTDAPLRCRRSCCPAARRPAATQRARAALVRRVLGRLGRGPHRRCSLLDYLLGGCMRRPPLVLHRGQPRAHRRGDGARHRRGGLPRLQREQRPAVRAHVRAEGRRAERREPREGQRGARRRRPRRRRRRRSTRSTTPTVRSPRGWA